MESETKPLIALLCIECKIHAQIKGALFVAFGKSLCEHHFDETIEQAKVLAENMRKAQERRKIQTL